MIFGNIVANAISGSGGLTIGAGLTIQGGSGRIDSASSPLISEGTIIADGAGSIITIRANPFTNNGSVHDQRR